MLITRIAASYFGIVFAAGFVLGVARIAWVEPLLGARSAELIELPFMVAASYLTARYLLSRTDHRLTPRQGGLVGLLALAILLAVELTAVLAVRGISLSEYLATRDPVSGVAYLVSLILFSLMPVFIVIRKNKVQGRYTG